MRNRILILTMLSLLLSTGVRGQAGGIFTIPQSAIAAGGGPSSSGSSSVVSTVGQPAAGTAIGASGVVITAGFWKYSLLAPTAATVHVSGRVKTPSGLGIPNVSLTLFMNDGSSRSLTSNPFGYYRFDMVMAGETVILEVSGKNVIFSQPLVALNVAGPIEDLDFVGEPF